jgi:hypothetical protein
MRLVFSQFPEDGKEIIPCHRLKLAGWPGKKKEMGYRPGKPLQGSKIEARGGSMVIG